MTKDLRPRRMLVNDDGWLLGECGPPLTPEDLRDRMVATYESTPVDTLLWSVGGNEVYQYETEVGDINGEGRRLDSLSERRVHEIIMGLIREHGGPLTAMARVCREAGMGLFPSLRMNQHYEIDPSSPQYSRLRREHPEWLIGRGDEELTPYSIEWGIRTGLDFTVPQVREHLLAIICELFERFDVEGVELDFQRHPGYFRIDAGYSSRYLITDLIRRAHARMDVVNEKGDRRVELAVRVPETLADAARIGLDMAEWIEEGIVDIVIVGGGFVPFGMRIEEFVEAARGTSTRVFGCIESMRPAADDEAIRAIASRIWSAGADGVYLFNYWSRSVEWKRRVLNQIGSPEALAGLDKRYEVDHTDRVMGPSQIGGAFRHGHPPIQLPVTLEPTYRNRGPLLRLPVADDLASARDEGCLAACTLRLRLERFAAGDRLGLLLNGEEVPWGSADVSYEGWSDTTHAQSYGGAERTGWRRSPWHFEDIAEPAAVVELDVGCPPLRQGENRLEVALVRDGGEQGVPVILRDVELDVRFSR